MSERTDTALLEAWDAALATWPERPSFRAAVAAATNAFGYAAVDVDQQLRHVIARCRANVLRTLVEREVPSDAQLPTRVLVLASGGVPGLVLESIASAMALGATAVVRPSRDEQVLDQLYADLPALLVEHIEIVTGEPPWDDVDAAVVHGSDETIALVRSKLAPPAAARIAAYGSRQGIAIVTANAVEQAPDYARAIADDVLTFRQRGCMSPSWIFVVEHATKGLTQRVIGDVGRELARARTRHLAPDVRDDAATQRRSSDADVLGAIAAGLAPDPRVLHAGDARLTVVGLESIDSLFANVAPLGSLLQTATLVATDGERPELEATLTRAGCTRVVASGEAHRPNPLWPQDGIGRLAPLVG